jgi:hypothetical protein
VKHGKLYAEIDEVVKSGKLPSDVMEFFLTLYGTTAPFLREILCRFSDTGSR